MSLLPCRSVVWAFLVVVHLLLCVTSVHGSGWIPFVSTRKSATHSNRHSEAALPTATMILTSEGIAAREQSRALWEELKSRSKMSACWKESLAALQSECAVISANDALRGRLALAFASCDGESDGRGEGSVFRCLSIQEDGLRQCIRGLSDAAYALFVQYRLHVDVLCAYLQEELFHHRTAVAVAALQTAAADSARAMATLTESSGHLLSAVREGRTAQEQTQQMAAQLHVGLGTLQAGQTEALGRLQVTTSALHAKASDAERLLSSLRESVEATGAEATNQLNTLHNLAVEHYEVLERRTSGLLHLLGRVEEVQRVLAARSLTAQDIVKYGVVGIIVLVSTTPQRTAAARLPALGLVALGWLAPLGLQLAFPWCAFSSGAAAVLIYTVARTYKPPSSLERNMLREELSDAFARFTTPLPTRPHTASTQEMSATHDDNLSRWPALMDRLDAAYRSPVSPARSVTPLSIHHEEKDDDYCGANLGTAAGRRAPHGRSRRTSSQQQPRSASTRSRGKQPKPKKG